MFKDRLCVIIIVGTKNNSHRCFFVFLRKSNAETAFLEVFFMYVRWEFPWYDTPPAQGLLELLTFRNFAKVKILN
jgi:hypothetical protein